jgi:hypothetical protein
MFVSVIIPGFTTASSSTEVGMWLEIATIGQLQSFSQFGYRCLMSTMMVKVYLDFL